MGISSDNLLTSLVNHPACNDSSLASAVVFNLPSIIYLSAIKTLNHVWLCVVDNLCIKHTSVMPLTTLVDF